VETFIAVTALLVSIIGVYISHKADRRSKATAEDSQRNLRESSKADLLALMSECYAVLNDARIEIGALKAEFDAEPDAVKRSLNHYVALFTEYLPTIEAALETWDADRKAVERWGGHLSFADIMREKARIQSDLKNFQNAARQGEKMVSTFREKLELARRTQRSE
jgi:hypothetical protein